MKRLALFLLLVTGTVHAFDNADWIAALDTCRADFLAEARRSITVNDDAEDTEPDFTCAVGILSTGGNTVTFRSFTDLGETFQVCIEANEGGGGASDAHTCFEYTRAEIEK